MYDGAVNLTLQSAAKVIRESINELSDHGVAIPGCGDAAQLYAYTLFFSLTKTKKGKCQIHMLQFFDGFKLRMLAPSNFIFSS